MSKIIDINIGKQNQAVKPHLPHQIRLNILKALTRIKKNEFNNQTVIYQEGKNTGIAKFYIQLGQIFQLLHFSVILIIDCSKQSFSCRTFLAKNQNPLKSNSQRIINDVSKLMHHYNMKKNLLNPQLLLINKQITYSISRHLSNHVFLSKNQAVSQLAIKGVYFLVAKSKLFLPKVLNLINCLPMNFKFNKAVIPYFQKLEEQSQRISSMNKHLEMILVEQQISQNVKNHQLEKLEANQQNNDQAQSNYDKIQQDQSLNNKFILQVLTSTKVYTYSLGFQPAKKRMNIQQQQLTYHTISKFMPKPIAIGSNKLGQNKFIFNLIKIFNQEDCKLKPFEQNAQYKTNLAFLKYVYVQSIPQKAQMKQRWKKNQQHLLQKIVFLRVPKSKKQALKMQHQQKIIGLLRNSYSPHLFKYYKSYRLLDDPQLNGLFMDASTHVTLKNYFEKFKKQISLRSKLFLLAQVAQGLRTLRDCRVVHMNLNPNNILILKDLQIKLVNFTGAFNQKVCQQDYILDYNLPYTAPQVFTPGYSSYNERQDVFSFGIVAYQIVFDDLLFQNVQNLINNYSDKSFAKKMFFCIENQEETCARDFLSILTRLILQCLDPDPLKRPSPTWIQIIIKELIFCITKF